MKGMMFSESMFHAVIEGRKTQTRRIVKPPKKSIRWYSGNGKQANM